MFGAHDLIYKLASFAALSRLTERRVKKRNEDVQQQLREKLAAGGAMSLVLDVAIGLASLFLLLALVVTTALELVATIFKWRAKDLYSAIESMLLGARQSGASSKDLLVDAVFAHPLIKNLREYPHTRDRAGGPSYIPSETFARAFFDVLRQQKTASDATNATATLEAAKRTIATIQVPELKQALLTLVDTARRKVDDVDNEATLLTTAIENWFNDRMARASGWYKRKTQCWALCMAGGIVLFANADSIAVARALWTDGPTREAVVAQAKTYYEANVPRQQDKHYPAPTDQSAPDGTTVLGANDPLGMLKNSPLPLGWNHKALPKDALECVLKLVGLFLTTLAVSLGAEFWFNLLGRLLQIRGTGLRISAATGHTQDDDG